MTTMSLAAVNDSDYTVARQQRNTTVVTRFIIVIVASYRPMTERNNDITTTLPYTYFGK